MARWRLQKTEQPLAQLAGRTTLASKCWVVGLSGGRDSVALLHRLCKEKVNAPEITLRALHINHALSPNAKAWAEHCEAICKKLGIALQVRQVEVALGAGISIEAAARDARYRAFLENCAQHELMVLAQHADDQIETFFLQLLRGAGARGLAAMPVLSPATTQRPALWRPLLATLRSEIERYVDLHQLTYIEDESNADLRFKRNALRHAVLPAIAAHFPDYRKALLRSIALQQQTLAQLNAKSESVVIAGPLPLHHLQETSAEHASELFRRWLLVNALPLPPAARTKEAVRQLQGLTTDQHFKLALNERWRLIVRNHALVALDARDDKPAKTS